RKSIVPNEPINYYNREESKRNSYLRPSVFERSAMYNILMNRTRPNNIIQSIPIRMASIDTRSSTASKTCVSSRIRNNEKFGRFEYFPEWTVDEGRNFADPIVKALRTETCAIRRLD
ncbi:unnamed protein product, partial [Nesidiocoris tenuis]